MHTMIRSAALGTVFILAASLPAPLGAQERQGHADGARPELFLTAESCLACHNGVTAPDGEDLSFGTDWRGSMMANSARDPYWQAAVRRETLDHPGAGGAIQDECSKCHMPMMRFTAHAAGSAGEVFANAPAARAGGPMAALAADGVSCTVCHQIEAEGLGEEGTFTGGFHVDREVPAGERRVHGPFEVGPGPARAMQSSSRFRPTRSPHIQQAALCASCHTLYTHARNERGEVVGELPEQVPYLEWLHSRYAEERACQSCHMPEVAGETPVSSVLATPRPQVSRHVFRGGNFFMPRVFNAFRGELAVRALPAELDAVATRTRENLRERTARIGVAPVDLEEEGVVTFDVEVANLAGHKLPTAYPSRRTWLHVVVTDAAGNVVFESGGRRPDGSIVGNDNDVDPARFEPHHRVISVPEQVQVYEVIMADGDGRVTTGLLRGVRYVKDNRLLPRGFEKETAEPDVAVVGEAASDDDFVGGADRVRYRVAAPAAPRPLRIRAELWYQPIGFRWARNLDGLGTVETDRFVRYYDAVADASAFMVAAAERPAP